MYLMKYTLIKIGKKYLDDREMNNPPSPNTAYTLRAYALALRDIAPFGRNVVYAGNVRRNDAKVSYDMNSGCLKGMMIYGWKHEMGKG